MSMGFMNQAIGQMRQAGADLAVPLSKALSAFIESLDPDSKKLVTGLQFKLDEDIALVGGRGIPTSPFVINPKLFQLDPPNNPEAIPSNVLAMGVIKLIQFPLIEYRSRIITRLNYFEKLNNPEQKDFFDGLVEYGCYLHLVQSIRYGLNDPNVADNIKSNRRIVLAAIADAFSSMEGYQPLAKLINFALTQDESFPTRMQLALDAASSSIYKESAYLTPIQTMEEKSERRFLAHQFTQKIINNVGGVRTASNEELCKVLHQRLESTKDEEEVIKLLAELATLENLDINPFSKPKPTNYEEWIELVASKDRWQNFSLLSPSEQFELLVNTKVLFDAHKDIVEDFDYLNPLLELFQTLPPHNSETNLEGKGLRAHDVELLTNLGMQLPDLLEEASFSHESAQDIIFAIRFFEQYRILNKDLLPKEVEGIIENVKSINNTDTKQSFNSSVTDDKRLKLDIKDLSERFSRGDLEPIDVLKILQIYVGSNEHVSGTELNSEYPSDLTTWLKYIIQKGHTHSFGAFAGRGEAESESIQRIEAFSYLLKQSLPLYALADTLREWKPWSDQLHDPLVAAVTLIAFESKLDVIDNILAQVKTRMSLEGDIFNQVFTRDEFEGLPSEQKVTAMHYRDLFIQRSAN